MSTSAQQKLESLGLSANCTEVLRHLWDYLDDEVTPQSAERLRAHIASCGTCREYEEFQSCFLDAVSRLRANLDAPETVRERIAQKLRSEGCGCWAKVKKQQ